MFVRSSSPIPQGIDISVGQALLILIKKYAADADIKNELIKLYLCGATTKEAGERILFFLKDEALKRYTVKATFNIINEDASRRYFETQLAFYTLKITLEKISMEDLGNYWKELWELTPLPLQTILSDDLSLSFEEIDKEKKLSLEYNNLIKKLSSDKHFKQFNIAEKEKLILMMKCSYLCMMLASAFNTKIPLALYGQGYFSEKQRGRLTRGEEQSQVCSRYFGIMKSYMPVPDDDISLGKNNAELVRVVDNYYCIPGEWIKFNFQKLVHPFAASISGTVLAQLRLMFYLKRKQKLVFTNEEKFTDYFRCLCSFLLYASGGHSIHEFAAVFWNKNIQVAFHWLPNFANIDEKKLFHDGNEPAFTKALKKAIQYNEHTILKKEMHAELTEQQLGRPCLNN